MRSGERERRGSEVRIDNLIEQIAGSIYLATRDLQPIQYVYQTPKEYKEGKSGTPKTRRPEVRDITSVAVFEQMWGSTALGFGGIGGAAMTTALTVCLRGHNGDWCVYFSGRFAYRIDTPNERFHDDMRKRRMLEVASAKKAYEVTQ
jgi:hypothetical protein